MPNNVTSIGVGAFAFCVNLTSITIPNGVMAIDGGMFMFCAKLASVTISSNATSIGGLAFWGCIKLTNITIPASVASIGNTAFSGCTALTTVYVGRPSSQGVTSLSDDAFALCPIVRICVPNNDSVAAYRAAKYWSAYANCII